MGARWQILIFVRKKSEIVNNNFILLNFLFAFKDGTKFEFAIINRKIIAPAYKIKLSLETNSQMRQRRGFLKTNVNIIVLHAFSCILAFKINHVEEHPTVTANSEWALIRQKVHVH